MEDNQVENNQVEKDNTNDFMKELCIKQGYVPSTCLFNGQLIFLLVQHQGDPCKGCNMDRSICKGRNK